MIWKEIFGVQTVSPSLCEAQHNAVLATAEAFGSLSHPNNPGHLGYNSGHLSHRTESRLAAPSEMALTAYAVFPGVAQEDQRLGRYWGGAVNTSVIHRPWSSGILPFHAAIAQNEK